MIRNLVEETCGDRPVPPHVVGAAALPVLVELPHAGNVRMLGNLLGDATQEVKIGAPVEAMFEPHDDAATPYTLVQWKTV